MGIGMNRIRRFLFLIWAASFLLGGCLPTTIASTLPIKPSITATVTSTAGMSEPQATLTPTQYVLAITPSSVEARATDTPALPPEDILRYQPLEITHDPLPEIRRVGIIVLQDGSLYLLRFDPQVTMEAFDIGDGSVLSASPDGQWLAYIQYSDTSPTGQWLIIESADQQQQHIVPMPENLLDFWCSCHWLDSQRLIFPLVRGKYDLRPMVVINPFTGEQLELPADYPDQGRLPAGLTGSMAFNISDEVYDPSLNLVAYTQYGPQSYIVVWDRQSNSVLAKVEEGGVTGHYPLWSPDAKQLVVAVKYQSEGDEWFSVSREGRVERLTHFGDYFVHTRIGTIASWSPDGQKVAFWLETSTGLCPGERLAVLEMATRQVTNTCIPGAIEYDPPPIWSLDSRYAVVINAEPSPNQTLLVDFEQGRAFDITEYGAPVGWLALP
jgi:Tol biopolymer transport system component